MSAEHPFAQYVRILGKGPRLSRPLTEAETFEAARMIMTGDVEPVQLGAFLCLLRMSGETPEELAGFARAAALDLKCPPDSPSVDVDWPSYAGKKHRLPWYLLSALLLARNGVRVFMHGEDEHTEGRLYAGACLSALGVPIAGSLDEAARHLRQRNFAYLPLVRLSPRLHELMALKPLIGLRNPVHTIVRQLNPFGAGCQVVGVAHPFYRTLHQAAGALLGQHRLAVFKGDGGEAERRPEKPCEVAIAEDGEQRVEMWPAQMAETALVKDAAPQVERLRAVWTGAAADPVGEAAVIGTAAVVLKTMGRVTSQDEAMALAEGWWRTRLGNG